MSDQPREQGTEDEPPAWVRDFLEQEQASEPKEVDPDRAWKYAQPLGFNEDGTPVHRLTREERRRIEDIREGRVTVDPPEQD